MKYVYVYGFSMVLCVLEFSAHGHHMLLLYGNHQHESLSPSLYKSQKVIHISGIYIPRVLGTLYPAKVCLISSVNLSDYITSEIISQPLIVVPPAGMLERQEAGAVVK